MIYITRREEFSASHRLHNPELSDEENRRVYGICNNPNGHGHNYAIEVTVRGPVPSRTGMVMDLKQLKDIIDREVLAKVDHKHLNFDVPFLKGVIPTAENVAVVFWKILAPVLQKEAGAEIDRVRLYESRSNFIDYFGPEGRR